MAFAKIPLMIENHSRYRPKKINAKGELSFIGIYTQLKAYIPSSINEDDFNNHPEKPHAIGLRLRAMNPMTTNHGRWLPPAIVLKWSFKSSVF
jgi:iron complex outermembrane receptor protein